MDDFSKNLATNLVAYRAKRDWSQLDLAQFIGIPRATVANLESGAANPSLDKILRISKKLGMSVEELSTHNTFPFIEKHSVKLSEPLNLMFLNVSKLIKLEKEQQLLQKKLNFKKIFVLSGGIKIKNKDQSWSVAKEESCQLGQIDGLAIVATKPNTCLLID